MEEFSTKREKMEKEEEKMVERDGGSREKELSREPGRRAGPKQPLCPLLSLTGSCNCSLLKTMSEDPLYFQIFGHPPL